MSFWTSRTQQQQQQRQPPPSGPANDWSSSPSSPRSATGADDRWDRPSPTAGTGYPTPRRAYGDPAAPSSQTSTNRYISPRSADDDADGWSPRPRRPSRGLPPARGRSDSASTGGVPPRYGGSDRGTPTRELDSQPTYPSRTATGLRPSPAAGYPPPRSPSEASDLHSSASGYFGPRADTGTRSISSSRAGTEDTKSSPPKDDGVSVKPRSKCGLWFARWLMAEAAASLLLGVCAVYTAFHAFLCGGSAVMLLLILPTANKLPNGAYSFLGLELRGLDATAAETVQLLGFFMAAGLAADALALVAARKAKRTALGYAFFTISLLTQLVRTVFLFVIVGNSRTAAWWDRSSDRAAKLFLGTEIVQVLASGGTFAAARWRERERARYATAAVKPTSAKPSEVV
ncbi:hypothetical protein H9P43_002101 [Blastocladiella emersonii ATCC 22665]|nr:hypothetical protein H9P43_002101 [Blastocladiella emersonii ATCC 22665]